MKEYKDVHEHAQHRADQRDPINELDVNAGPVRDAREDRRIDEEPEPKGELYASQSSSRPLLAVCSMESSTRAPAV